MKRVTPFTAVRGLVATVLIVLLAGVVLLMAPFALVIGVVIFTICVLRSDSWRETWEMFGGGLDDAFGGVADLFRGLGELWVTEDR